MIDLLVIRKNANYRRLFLGQLVSFFGTMISVTVIPFQVYQLTHSSAMVGLISVVELVPLLCAAFLGGAIADHVDRKKLLVSCEILMSMGVAVLALNSCLARPHLGLIFGIAALLQAIAGFHRPAMDSLAQALLKPEEIPSAVALNSFRYGFAALIAPSLGGIIIAKWGAPFAYSVDLATFVFSVFMLAALKVQHLARSSQKLRLAHSLKEGLNFALKRQEILGTYLVDLAAMTLAFPVALFPALSHQWSHPESIGFLYSAIAVGSMASPLLTSWTKRVRRQGVVIVIAAALWGIGIAGFGMASNFWIGLALLFLAGLADAISGIFRGMIWTQTIPNTMRGRMAGLEMISYMSGPLLGNARAGWVAAATSNQISLVSGGLSCFIVVGITGLLLPKFIRYRSPNST